MTSRNAVSDGGTPITPGDSGRSPSLSPPGSDLDGLELESLRASRDHAPETCAALELAAQICEQQAREFLSPEYATQQPLSSFSERFACGECARAIRAEAARTSAKPHLGESPRDELLDRLSQLEAELKRRDDALREVKDAHGVLLEAAYEAVAELGETDGTAERFLIPAILKADADPDYARSQFPDRAALQPQEGGDA